LPRGSNEETAWCWWRRSHPRDFRHAHLPGAINIPADRVPDLAPRLLPDRHAMIVVYCAAPT
jgi:rhodanese-related sulfurtransferase